MTLSIRWPIGFFNRLRKQQRTLQRSNQFVGGGNVTFQMANHACHAFNPLVGQRNVAGHHQGNSNYPVQVGQAGNAVEIDNGQRSSGKGHINVANFQGSGLAGVLGHDGSFKYFKWDTAQGCMVEVAVSTPFPQRLARSFDAFLRSGRLG